MLNTNYNKTVILILTVLIATIPEIVAQAGLLGLTPTVAAWISLIGTPVGVILHLMVPNLNQPTVPPGHVVVPASQVLPGAAIKFARAASIILALLLLSTAPVWAMGDELLKGGYAVRLEFLEWVIQTAVVLAIVFYILWAMCRRRPLRC